MGKKPSVISIICVLSVLAAILTAGAGVSCAAQSAGGKYAGAAVQGGETPAGELDGERKTSSQDRGKQLLGYRVENGDTVFYDSIKPAKVFMKMPRQKGREWRKYYRLVHNFSKAYPYALVARKMVMQTDSIIAADHLKGLKKDRYINGLQKELFGVFEKQLRNLTVSQGMLIMKLVDRETGRTSYNIIKEYKSGITAGFWQGIAKMFGSDMKKPYDPEGDDRETEELVKIWEDGDFPALYWSIFWEDPPEVKIPEKYRNWKPVESD